MKDLNLRIDDEEKIRDIIENAVGIVILGSKSWAKAIVVNELLGYALLPVSDLRDSDLLPPDSPPPPAPPSDTMTAAAAATSSSSGRNFLSRASVAHNLEQEAGGHKSSSLTSSGATAASFALTSSSVEHAVTSDGEIPSQVQPSANPLHANPASTARILGPGGEKRRQGGGNWRTIRLMYGPETQVSLSVSNQYELVEHLAVYDRMWHQVPRSELELNLSLWQESQSPSDPGYCAATLEIKLPHHLLSEDTQIIVSPTLASGHVSFESIYHTCFDGVSPVVIYALSDAQSLTPNEVDDLMELQRLSPKIPVFFIRTQRSLPPPDLMPARGLSNQQLLPDHLSVNSASELTESQQHLLFGSQATSVTTPPASASVTTGLLNQPNGSSQLEAGAKDPESGATDVPSSQAINNNNDCHSTKSPVNSPPSSRASPSMEYTASDFVIGSSHLTSGVPTGSAQWYGSGSATLFQQLTTLGFLSPIRVSASSACTDSPGGSLRRIKKTRLKDGMVCSELVENFDNFPSILTFIRQVLQSHLVRAANTLNALHNRCLRVFILTAFDMTRDMLITPKRINYAKEKEQQLYESLMAIANKKQEEIRQMISDTLTGMRTDLLQEVAYYQFKNMSCFRQTSGITSPASGRVSRCPGQGNDQEASPSIAYYNNSRRLNGGSLEDASSSRSTIVSCSCSNEENRHMTEDERLDACMLAGPAVAAISPSSRSVSSRDYHAALNEIQDFVLSHLNAAIAGKLIGSVDCLRDSYVGTLERCLESLEKIITESSSPSPDVAGGAGHRLQFPGGSSQSLHAQHQNALHQNRVEATNALKSILNAAYQVEINMKTTSSLLRMFWEKIKSVVSSSWLWANPPIIDKEWKTRVASDILDKLSESRLAKSICSQFRERLKMSHENFLSAIKQLEAVHNVRLEKTEEHRLKVRKVYAPKIARYALESTSLKDLILHGMPQLGREIGRGQYGVVYACDSWAGHSPVALKSVVPPDDKHWNDLAMEFYYTRSIAEHERIVQIRGSVIDHSYGGGSTPAVLLIMDRLTRDLYSAIKNGLDWPSRLQVAIDVVQGIRFLHSQGLVHRDIKLKNVLLDKRNRAKITDLGFCKPEAMMSGSIVGTPIHMAPELFSGKYDASVDVYAFGILFWYICAGHVRLPYIFEQCQNKDQLWTCVRKGTDSLLPSHDLFLLLPRSYLFFALLWTTSGMRSDDGGENMIHS